MVDTLDPVKCWKCSIKIMVVMQRAGKQDSLLFITPVDLSGESQLLTEVNAAGDCFVLAKGFRGPPFSQKVNIPKVKLSTNGYLWHVQ